MTRETERLERSSSDSGSSATSGHHVCPWWVGYLLLNPLRRLREDPEKMLRPHVAPGMRVLDVGCAMGYFSLPLARLVGPNGRAICVDLQERMIARLLKRARRAGLAERITARVSTPGNLGVDDLAGQIDLALAIHVVHEVPDAAAHFRELFRLLRPGGRLLYVEPKGHVKEAEYERFLQLAVEAGFKRVDCDESIRSRKTLLKRP